MTHIDLKQLDRPQLEALIHHLESFMDARVLANNELIMRLAETGELTARCSDILNTWSAVNNELEAGSHAEKARIVGGRNGERVN